MKKILLPLLMIVLIISSCTKAPEKPFLVTDVDSVTVKDGSDNPTRICIKYAFGYDSTAVINTMISDEEELEQFVNAIFWNLKNECKYPRTFKPVGLLGFKVEDSMITDKGDVYKIRIIAKGIACNAFGVEQEINDYLDLLLWKEPEEADDGAFNYWHAYPIDKFWINVIETGIEQKITFDL